MNKKGKILEVLIIITGITLCIFVFSSLAEAGALLNGLRMPTELKERVLSKPDGIRGLIGQIKGAPEVSNIPGGMRGQIMQIKKEPPRIDKGQQQISPRLELKSAPRLSTPGLKNGLTPELKLKQPVVRLPTIGGSRQQLNNLDRKISTTPFRRPEYKSITDLNLR